MKLAIKKPRDFINPLLSKKSVSKLEFEQFKIEYEVYKSEVNKQHATKQSEPNIVSNALKPFIEAIGYKCSAFSQHGQSGIDLTILKDEHPAVIIEAKKYGSSVMITPDKPNTKALHEAVLYFMRERAKGNQAIFHIVITDFYSWYIFDAKDFERFFWKDSSVKKVFDSFNDPTLLCHTTQDFYSILEKEISTFKKDLIDDEVLDCAFFDTRVPSTEKDLLGIYKLLSQENLLKTFNPNDANSLNREFYNELLYILGLEEAKDKGKKVIQRSVVIQSGALYENISSKLTQYGKNNDFETVIKLIIIWVNRILFLKLLESQIVKWTADKNKKFLNFDKINEYGRLEELFFQVLALPLRQRSDKEFDYIPYLNSSLFEMHQDEKSGVSIAALSNSAKINYYAKTAIKDDGGKRKHGSVNTLGYLFEFLDAYDFGSDRNDEVVTEQKPLINASVLGLIFEKINGYKDGSFYTPSFITMYMAREVIQKTILDRFNACFDGLEANSWVELKRYCDKHSHKQDFLNKANPLIDTLTICDPAVGSGHFLVSALNEIIFAKYELGIFQVKGMRLDLENDELLINLNDEWFEYTRPASFLSPNHLLQEALFNEKQRVIENQLFGVDINPNSTQITKLRLWIELLKHSYYSADYQLVTLPNIDINIKTGNSLVKRFAFTDDLTEKKVKTGIANYKQKVKEYKENIGKKHDVMAAIVALKEGFNTTLKAGSETTKGLNQKLREYVKLFGSAGLTKELQTRSIDATYGQVDIFGADQNIARQNKPQMPIMLKKLDELFGRVKYLEDGVIYKNSFEWRFEFPEVLDDEGEFVGFDIVIGNPPYVFARDHFTLADRKYFNSSYSLAAYQLNLYILFLERGTSLLKNMGRLAYITPNNWLTINSAKVVREFVLHQSDISVINFYAKVFEDASVDTSILMFEKGTRAPTLKLYESSGTNSLNFKLVHEAQPDYFLAQRDAIINIAAFRSGTTHGLLGKIEAGAQPLDAVADMKVGLKAYQTGKGKPAQTEEMKKARVFHARQMLNDSYVPYLDGSDVQRYGLGWNGEYLSYGEYLAEPRNMTLFSTPRILVRQIPSAPPYSIHACYTTDTLLNDLNSMNIVNIQDMPLFLLGLLNSRLMTFWFVHKFGKLQRGVFPQFKVNELAQFPIAVATVEQKLAISERVEKILVVKKANLKADTSLLDKEIDGLVYDLYKMSDEEIKLIES